MQEADLERREPRDLDDSGVSPPAVRHLPNVLSILRVLCAVAIPFAPRSWWLALVLTAAASDWLDGYLARRLHATSWVGGLLDGFSDKAFVVTTLVTFALHDLLAWWQIPFLLLRDVSVGMGVAVSAVRRDGDAFRYMDSRTFGKFTTVVIFALFATLLLWPEATGVHGTLYTAGAILSATAGGDYYLSRRRRILGT